ncbi:rhodanese-like domain-containing protein [Demequina zhanjiangensis]|uniref:Rhodanese-like domain-containing protein n=1 Tax=Demequina zhanjiangensis TaxID=3051659 RepID=A0ABT8G4H0_9MICO|nr:rhodanese-like domain-containing protein [Demequina sp. SYSU T00b26]MDN4474030.1 rhodanese-like domain-containing protein [Demequina sp. SYSU T00b26]
METVPTPAQAAAHFAARLSFETDCSDVHAALESGEPGFVLIDTRNVEAWEQGHVRGAIHMPKPDMPARIPAEFPEGTQFVVYCWGPGCNGATRAGLIISELGYAVKEMIGGFEYWAREGLPVDREAHDQASGITLTIDATRVPDPLTAVASTSGERIACDC